MTATLTRYVPVVTVRCPGCGDLREISDRQHRRQRADGRPMYCHLCAQLPEAQPADSDRRYWLLRLTDQEIAEITTMLFGVTVTAAHVRFYWPRHRLLKR